MKVAFWSNSSGKTGVTGNMSCISILSAMLRSSKMVLFENHSSINNLGSVLLNQNSYTRLQEKQSYFVENGLERILSSCHVKNPHESLNQEMFYHLCYSVFDNRVFYLPTGGMNPDLMEYRLKCHAEGVLEQLEQLCGIVCVDLSSSPLESSRKILQESDLVVVNLCQNNQLLSHFFRNFSDIRKKAFYVIGNYDSESVITKSDIVMRFSLSPERVGTIPYSRRYADALTNGQIVPFLLKNEDCRPENVNYDFMQAAKETVYLFEKVCMIDKEDEQEKKKGGEIGDAEKEKKKGNSAVHSVHDSGSSV